MAERFSIEIAPKESVTALLYKAALDPAGACFILAHGAGGNQLTGFMTRFAGALAGRGIDVLTFNFLYTEQKKRVPDRNDKLEACWSRVIERVCNEILPKHLGARKLFIGGKSMGGRIASQFAAQSSDGISGLLFLGYPLHPPGRPDQLRSKHLQNIRAPMLFVQGENDAFGTPIELRPILRSLKASADLAIVEGGDHSFKVKKSAGFSQDTADAFVLDTVSRWLGERTFT